MKLDLGEARCAFAVVLVFVLLYLGYHFLIGAHTWADENIHLYVARAISEGGTLYGDLHSARPPLMFPAVVLALKLGATPLLAARLVVFVSVVGTCFALYFLGTRIIGRRAATFAAVFFLAAPATWSRTTLMGINQATLWSTLAVLFACLGSPWRAGVLGGIGIASGQHVVPLVLGLGPLLLLPRVKSIARYLVAVAAVLFLVVGAVLLAGGEDIYADLVGRHFHQVGGANKNTKFGWWVRLYAFDHLPWILLVSYFLLSRAEKGTSNVAPLNKMAIGVALHLGILLLMANAQSVYIQPIIPLVALLAGAGLDRFLNKRRTRTRLLVAGTMAVFLTAITWRLSERMYVKLNKKDYAFLPHVRIFQVMTGHRFSLAEKMADHLRRVDPDGGPVFGHPTAATLVALLSERRIAGSFADFDPIWLKSGSVRYDDLFAELEESGIRYFVAPRFFFRKDKEFKAYLKKCFRAPTIFQKEKGSGLPRMFLFERGKEPYPCRRKNRS